MKEKLAVNRILLMRIMAWLGGIAAVTTVAARVWLLPSIRDWETGLYPPHYLVIVGMLLVLAALAVLGYLAGGERSELTGLPSHLTAVALLISGALLAVSEVLQVWPSMLTLRAVAATEEPALFQPVLQILQNLFGLFGGIALLLLGLRMLSEGGTRRGIAQWSVLLPVAWIWLRLVNYEVSYSSMVRLKDSFFGLLMMILELLFLFKLARYTAGVGRSHPGRLMGYAMATAVFALSAPLTRWIMYLLGDGEAYNAHHLAGPVDFAIGLLALVFGLALLRFVNNDQVAPEEPEVPAPGMVDAAGLVTSVPEEEPEE